MIQVGVKKTRQKDKRTRRYSAAWFLIFLPLIFLPGKRFDDSSWSKKKPGKKIKGQEDIPLLGSLFSCLLFSCLGKGLMNYADSSGS
jgi:hypothetical protein